MKNQHVESYTFLICIRICIEYNVLILHKPYVLIMDRLDLEVLKFFDTTLYDCSLFNCRYKFKFQIPSYFSLVIRSLAVLEGIAISQDPNYKVLGSTYPWIARKVLIGSSPKLKASLQALLYKDGMLRVDRLESLVTESLRARTDRAIRKQIEDGDSRLIFKQILSFSLDEQGSFVREILLAEFAKGLEAMGLATLGSITSAVTSALPFSSSQSVSLMTNEDVTNLRNFHRLVLLVSGFRKDDASTLEPNEVGAYDTRQPSANGASMVIYQSVPVQELQMLLSVISELPQDLQQRLLELPADLAGKLVSRITARTLRRVLL